MIKEKNLLLIEKLADIISEIIPKEYQFKRKIFKFNMTFKDQFIIYCIYNAVIPKTTEDEILRASVLYILNENMETIIREKKVEISMFGRLLS